MAGRVYLDLQVQRARAVTIAVGKHGAGAVAQSLHLNPQARGETAHWEWCGLLELKTCLWWHTSSYKTTPPNPSQAVPTTEDQVFKYVSL